jgi:hypothetical protein
MSVTVLSGSALVVLGFGPHPFTFIRHADWSPALVPNFLDHWLATPASGNQATCCTGCPLKPVATWPMMATKRPAWMPCSLPGEPVAFRLEGAGRARAVDTDRCLSVSLRSGL